MFKRVAAAGRELDPRTVKLRDPSHRPRWWVGAAITGVALLAGAAAIAASSSDDSEIEKLEPPPASAPSQARTSPVTPTSKPIPPRSEPAPQIANFHDPIYVFTEGPITSASAYPLAEPPGIVIDLVGAPEPEASARQQVGEDSRIRTLKRRVTAKGLRYVIGLAMPVKRLEVIHEGNVVIVFPKR